MIIGITGMLGAGKGTVADYLVKQRGFKHLSVRAFLTEEILKRRLDVNRDNMVFVANDLREKYGPGYIAEQLYEVAVKGGGDYVIESLRSVGEVEALRNKGEFILFGVDANIETRYARIVERGSSTDSVSFDEFVSQEEREAAQLDPTKGNLRKCIEIADHKFMNDWTIEELHGKVGAVLGKIGSGEEKYMRPSWDEYFMEIARTVAKRGTCDRGRSGAVIVRDKQILVTGYVGSPPGFPHCDDVGHKMEEWTHDGVVRQHCIRTAHAEANAICQAAKLGIPIEGATLYCKMTPCDICAKMIITSGIKRIVCEKVYHAAQENEFYKTAGIKLDVLDKTIEQYEGQ
jgi:dCMP deaminase